MEFSLDTIGEMLAIADFPATECSEIDALARTQLVKVESRLLQAALNGLIASCSGGKVAQCRIIETLTHS